MNRGTHVVLDPVPPKTGSPGEGASRLGCNSEVGICVTLILEHRWSGPHLDVSLSSAPSPREVPEFIIQHTFINACLVPGEAVPGCLGSLARAAAGTSVS